MSMHKHVTQLACSCYVVLRQLRSIRRSLPRAALTTLVSSFTMSKVDYCNVVLAGLKQRELDRVQSVVNAAARLSVANIRTPLLMNTLPSEIQSSPSLTLFRQRLKTYLFQKSFPDVLL